MKLSFGLGESISVNAIIGLPTLKEWKLIMDMDSSCATSKLLGQEFPLTFKHAASGFPDGVAFAKEDFVRPLRHTPSGLSLLCQASTTALATLATSPDTTPITILDTTETTPAIQGDVE